MHEPTPGPDGGFIDEAGCYFDSIPSFIGSELGLCGCGHAENIVFLAWRALDLINTKTMLARANGDTGALWDRLTELLPDTPQGELLFHVMDHAGWLEHGTSIRGSWLTEDGELALKLLTQHAATSEEWMAEVVGESQENDQ